MPLIPTLAIIAVFLSLAMAGAWLLARLPNKSGWADTIWSFATGVGGIIAAFAGSSSPVERQILVAALVGCWSFRLGAHILERTLKGKDDARYVELREEWGVRWQFRLFLFLQIQAVAAFFLLLSVSFAARNSAPVWAWSDLAGAAILIVAIAGESVADRQLRSFVSDPANKGKVNDQGLWALSRHPNYFFEWVGWWAYPLIAIGPALQIGWQWLSLTAPALMYLLLVHASGIPPTEAHLLRSRGDAFRSYQKRVNAFFPGPNRR